MIWLILLLISIPLMYYFIKKPYRYWKDKGVKQGKPIPIFGDMLDNITGKGSLADIVQKTYHSAGNARYIGFYSFTIPSLFINDLDLIKQILVKDFDHFVDHFSFVNAEADPLWGKNLFALTGQKWREMRATLSPSFTTSKMRSMFNLMSEAAENFTEYFARQDQDIITVELKDTFTRFTNDVIATCAFGVKVDSLTDRNNEFYLMGKEATDFSSLWKNIKFFLFMILPQLRKIIHVKLFNAKVSHFFRTLVKETIRIREREGIVRPDMIHLLMEARKGIVHQEDGKKEIIDAGFATVQESDTGKKAKALTELTDDDITAQALVFFFGGFDSVSGLMCFTSYELAINQDCQDRLREEIRETLETCGGKLTYESLLNMKYLDMVISESLRKWPNLASTDRVCTKSYTIQPGNPDERPVHLKCNDAIVIPVFAIQRDPKYFPNPDKFDPERFSDDNKSKIVPYSYLPFGAGPRNCIGSRFALLEVKAVLFHLLSKFMIVPVEKTDIPLVISPWSAGMTAKNGFWLGLEKL